MMKLITTKNSWRFIFSLAILYGVVYSCANDLDRTFSENIILSHSEIIVPAEVEARVSIDFNSSVSWQAASDVSWISIPDEFKSGEKGENRIDILVEPNTSVDKREGKIIVSSTDGEISKEMTIIQEAEEEEEPEIQTRFYVKEDGDGNGRSWGRAMAIQDALDNAIAGDTIFIAQGTYTPTKTITNGDRGDNRDKTFEISENIAIIGGFSSDATDDTDDSERDPSKYETKLSGQLEGGNAYHTVVVSAAPNPGEQVTIEGVTIRDGASEDKSSKVEINNAQHERWYGGGINIANAVVNLTNVKITENNNLIEGVSSRAAGVMITDDSRVTFTNCSITNNVATSNHGGMRIDDSTVYMFDTEVSYNSGNTSAGIYTYGSSAELFMYNCEVKANQSSEYGTGLYISWGSTAYIVNSLIIDNINAHEGDKGGAGLMLYKANSTAYVISSTITGNEANKGSAVLGLTGTYNLHIYNSIVSGNTNRAGGSEIFAASGSFDKSFKSSVVDGKFYDDSGNEISDAIGIDDIIDSDLVPKASPATDKGMSGANLTANGDIPTLSHEEYLDIDYNSNSRTDKIMGALISKD